MYPEVANKSVSFLLAPVPKGAVCQKPILTDKRLGYQTAPFVFL